MTAQALFTALTAQPPSQAASRHAMPPAVEAAIRSASVRTGVDFSYLVEKAATESSFRTELKARTSSATGLYQFIESTWLQVVKDYGAKHGLGGVADAINRDADGRYRVDDPGVRQRILDLRKNPQIAALMVGEFTRDNHDYLTSRVAGEIGGTELYLAHFMGPAGAAKFLNAMRDNPFQKGADLFPAAAAANTAIFYTPDGSRATTLGEIYNRFDRRFGDASGDDEVTRAVAQTSRTRRLASAAPVAAPMPNPLNGGPLSHVTKLALAALETPLDDGDRATAYGSRKIGTPATAPSKAEGNEFRDRWERPDT